MNGFLQDCFQRSVIPFNCNLSLPIQIIMKPLTSKDNGQHFVFYLCIIFLAWSQGFELASADMVTGSFGSKNLRTAAEEIEVFKHENASSSPCRQDHSTSSGVAGGVEHSSETCLG